MNLELTDEQTEALVRPQSQTIDCDRDPLSPRIVALKEILGQLRPGPQCEPPTPGTALRAIERGTLSEKRLAPDP